MGRSTSKTELLSIADTRTFDVPSIETALAPEGMIVSVANLSPSSSGGVIIGALGEWG